MSDIDMSLEDVGARYLIDEECENTGSIWIASRSITGIIGAAPTDGLIKYLQYVPRQREYLSARYGWLEKRAAYMLGESMSRSVNSSTKQSGKLINTLKSEQARAANLALSSPISLIIGGPGTGKTHTARVIASEYQNGTVVGLSPTGKGADRLSEGTGFKCYTIHRFVDCLVTGKITANGVRMIIIDESGMLDCETLHLCLWAMRTHCKSVERIILLGDSHQLPSVGPGDVLRQLSEIVPTAHLRMCHRTDEQGIAGAVDHARACDILDGGSTPVNGYGLLITDKMDDVLRLYAKQRAKFGPSETRIITYYHRDAYHINSELFKRYPREAPVVCVRNNYRAEVFNGQCGIRLDAENLVFNGRKIRAKSVLWQFGYATTCHKAQGGEWLSVIVFVPSETHISSNWLVTALSRARCEVILVTRNPERMRQVMTNRKAVNRISHLAALTRAMSATTTQ